MSKMKLIAFYLPQYHTIPENDEWWGKGFTEWTNVKKAKPVRKGQVQPKIPLHENYYCLLDDEVKKWQAENAKKAGIYGFCYYHYWFNGKMLLERPAEQMLQNKEIRMPFCFSWANEPWSRSWKGEAKDVIMAQSYGTREDWKKHFEYLLPFFRDERYIREDGKPMFLIYKPDIMPQCYEMLAYWNELAMAEGFKGMYFGCQFPTSFRYKENEKKFDFTVEFEPLYTRTARQDFRNISTGKGRLQLLLRHPMRFMNLCLKKFCNKCLNRPIVFDYRKTCEIMTKREPYFANAVPGMFTSWDKTPRNGSRATIYAGSTPKLFEKYLKEQIRRAGSVYKTDYLFLTAWNEWGEGAYLEPDCENGYGYLEAVRNALADIGEPVESMGEKGIR
ncbi:MAG: glycosyl transferase [Lachnospiraceae bacterium]|nr:glycosyl transferase [Lachnospiraceae bacterium]